MSPLRIAALSASLLGLAACATVGPDYRVPQAAVVRAPTAQGPFMGADFSAVSQEALPQDWWRLYDDPTLDKLVEAALSANTDLRAAAANLARARAGLSAAEAAREPTLSASAAAERAQVAGQAYLLDEKVPVETLGDAGLKVSYEIDLVGKLKRVSEAARADTESARAALEAAQAVVAANVAAAYVEACAAGAELSAAERTIALQQDSLAATSRLVAAGRGIATDVARSRAQLDLARAAAPPFEARRRAALYQLAVLTGRPPAEFPREVETCAAPPHLSRPIPVGDGAALLKRRPDVREAERGLAAATARIGVATAALYPSISLGAGLGTTGILGDLGQGSTNRWSLGGLIAWTLPGGGERARIRAADASADAALAKFDGVVLTALKETETGLSAYANELQRNAALKAARDEAALAADQTRALYRAGRAPYLSGLDAERTLAAAEAQLAASDTAVAADQVRLFLALGGGWGHPPPALPSRS